MIGPGEDDIGLGHRPFGQGLEPDPGEGVLPGAALDVGRRPVEAPGPVGVDVALAVFVDLAVAIVVEAFLAEHRPFALLSRLDADHQAGVFGVGLEPTEGVLLAHGADVAVAVEVVGRILVEETVPVVVDRDAQAAVAVRAVGVGHEVIAAVDVDDRHDIDADPVDEGRDLGVLAVAAEDIVEKVERDVAALDLIAVHVAVDVEGRLVEGGAGLGVVHGHGHEGPAFLAFPHGLERRQLGIGLGEGPQRFVNLIEGVVLVEPQRDRHLGFLRRQGRREEQDEQHGTGELFHLAPPRSTVRESPQAF